MVTRALSIRMYPSAHQKKILTQMMGAARFIYNMVVEEYRAWDASAPGDGRVLSDHGQLRLMLKTKMENPLFDWLNVLPYDMRDEVLKKAIISRTEVISRNHEQYQDRHHTLKWQARKDAKQTLVCRHLKIAGGLKIYARTFHSKKMYDTIAGTFGRHFRPKSQIAASQRPLHPFHPEQRRTKNSWPNVEGKVGKDSILTFHRKTNRWVFGWVYEKAKRSVKATENQGGPIPSIVPLHWRRTISCDPGVRTFLSYYSPTGSRAAPVAHYGKVGCNDMTRIVQLCVHLDHCQSRLAGLPAKKRWRLKLAMACIRLKTRRLVDEVHKQTACWMVREYDTIILPKLNVLAMSERRRGRKISSKTVRQMMTWAHSRFHERLVSKCEEYEDGAKHVIAINEAYTSRTCTHCGRDNVHLGGQERFLCNERRGGCGLRIDRDINGARNVSALFLQ